MPLVKLDESAIPSAEKLARLHTERLACPHLYHSPRTCWRRMRCSLTVPRPPSSTCVGVSLPRPASWHPVARCRQGLDSASTDIPTSHSLTPNNQHLGWTVGADVGASRKLEARFLPLLVPYQRLPRENRREAHPRTLSTILGVGETCWLARPLGGLPAFIKMAHPPCARPVRGTSGRLLDDG